MFKARLIVTVVLGSIGLMAATLEGCGGSSASYVSVCDQGCDKLNMCAPGLEDVATCKQDCASSAMTNCTNQSARISAGQACLAKDCAGFLACGATIPECEGGGGGTNGGSGGSHGSGGSNGSAGASGTGGASGSATCAICDKAATCCLAVGEPAATCNMLSASACNAVPAANQAQIISNCQTIVAGGASLNIAACK